MGDDYRSDLDLDPLPDTYLFIILGDGWRLQGRLRGKAFINMHPSLLLLFLFMVVCMSEVFVRFAPERS
jgi:hypothetical protein